MIRRLILVALLLPVLVWPAVAAGQTLTGTIAGRVTDEQGGVLPGVTVTLSSRTGAQTQVSDSKGEFRFLGLNPGVYAVRAELQGFRPKGQENIDLSIGRSVDVRLALSVGGVTETVQVTANAVTVDTATTATENGAVAGPAVLDADRSAPATWRSTSSTTRPASPAARRSAAAPAPRTT